MRYIKPMFQASRQVLLRSCLAVLIVYSGYQCVDFLKKAAPTVIGFIKAGGDHDVLRSEKIPYYKSVLWASRAMAPGETVRYSKEGLRTIDVIAIRYMLYPARVSEDGSTVMEFHNTNGYISTSLQAPRGTHVSYEFPKRSFFAEFIVFTTVSLIFILFGIDFLRSIGIGPRILGRVWFFGGAYLAGFAIINWVYWIVLMAGVNLSLPVVWGVLIVLYISSLFFPKQALNDGAVFEKFQDDPAQGRLARTQLRVLGAGALSAFVLVMVVLVTISVPLTVWDEMLTWVMRSKMLFFDGRIDLHYLERTHAYYPNLWPLHIHTFFKAAGGCYSETLKWVSASVFLAFVSQMIGAVKVLNFKRLPPWLPVCSYLLVFMNFIFFTALPENIFFALSLGVVVSLMMWLRETRDKRFLVLAFVMAAGLSGVKFEGGIIVLALTLSAAIAGRSSGSSFNQLSGLLWLLIPCAVPWMWTSWLKHNGYPYSIYHFGRPFVLENAGAILSVVMGSLSHWKNLCVLILMSATFIFAANRRPWDTAERLLGLVAAVFIGFSAGSVIFWPTEDIRLYFPEVLDRLFLRAAPFVMLLWASRVFDRNLFSDQKKNHLQ